MNNDRLMKTAVLIDAENISWKYAKLILDEAAGMGSVICKRIYGDWSSKATSSWKSAIMEYSLQAIQQFQNTTGKNSSDSALIIDAMDLLHEGKYQCICIVSSDSDFTRLAARLRESEVYVVGMGEQKTPISFRNACDKFQYLDVLLKGETKSEEAVEPKNSNDGKCQDATQTETIAIESGLNYRSVVSAIESIVAAESDEDGWCFLGDLGNRLINRFSDFDVRNFGYKKLSDFIRTIPSLEIKEEKKEGSSIKVVYIRIK